MGVPVEKVCTDRLYAGLDWLLPHKSRIEKHLKERLGSLFDLEIERRGDGESAAGPADVSILAGGRSVRREDRAVVAAAGQGSAAYRMDSQ